MIGHISRLLSFALMHSLNHKLKLFVHIFLKKLYKNLDDIKCVFVDEAQFLSSKQIDDLFTISKVFDVAVICYGLRINFKMEAFEGSKRLLEVADILEELKTICSCGKVARYCGRIVNGKFALDGEEVVIDGSSENIEYVPLCGDCYLKKVKKLDYNSIRKRGEIDG